LKANYTFEEVQDFFMQTIFLKNLELEQIEEDAIVPQLSAGNPEALYTTSRNILENNETGTADKKPLDREKHLASTVQSIISVSVEKLDKLMDLVGEMVIAEAMVIQNPDLHGLELNNFKKAARQLNKITSEIQDTVMAVRMVPLSATFHKMNRIVRDMCKNLHKEVQLEIEGEETEVDKNIIEHISDPLMHLVRNALDHGIETPEARQKKGKPRTGTVTLKAKNNGNDVLIVIKDDGKGLNKESILKKARENHLLPKSEADLSDNEIFNLILLPGFSTKDSVTEYSGRGVGMDVVAKNIEAIGGALSIESVPDKGTAISLKIPLTLAIIDGMNIKVGSSCYTIPTTAIKESFRPRRENIILDPDGNEMIMVRGSCYPILRLHEFYGVDTLIKKFSDGIIVMAEQDEKTICIFADELLGQQQVVVKALPEYIRRYKKINGITGCTLLGDGRISLILDIAGLIDMI
ncbi:MAG TPA: chemotaxis protein CheA, partial [Lachnospiraceae bacterium]|nr:chemotaxis protein CheA [Lachnospiraceae bacterium]